MTHAHVLPFDAPADAASADLDSVGGKGLSLARLTAAGFAVPAGFTVTTAAYRQFVSDDDLQQAIIDLANRNSWAQRCLSIPPRSVSRRCLPKLS